MANITICNLQPAGLSLFADSEGYLNDLTDTEQNLQGGIWNAADVFMATVGASASVGFFAIGVGSFGCFVSCIFGRPLV